MYIWTIIFKLMKGLNKIIDEENDDVACLKKLKV
jgi:hypothetical protein